VCFHDTVSVTVRHNSHRCYQITARSSVSTPPLPLTVRISGGDGAANGVETDATFKLGANGVILAAVNFDGDGEWR